ncbi:MAG TPA: hypothetical protein VNA17_00260 [Pyrinomonadaceae bacterium]|nr:hypothetical protein [Pyrinomonadaceae bacterium]
MKRWRELIGDEKILAEKLPMSAEFEPSARKKHLFCMRCWYEDTGSAPVTA